MKITLYTVVTWLLAHWAQIGQLARLAADAAVQVSGSQLSGAEKREYVAGALAEKFPDFGNAAINVAVELVVSVLRWKGVIK